MKMYSIYCTKRRPVSTGGRDRCHRNNGRSRQQDSPKTVGLVHVVIAIQSFRGVSKVVKT